MSAPEPDWIELNQRELMAAVGEIRVALDRIAKGEAVEETGNQAAGQSSALPSALQTLCSAFGLSRFERAILLLCAGVELDGRFAALCAAAHRDPVQAFPDSGSQVFPALPVCLGWVCLA